MDVFSNESIFSKFLKNEVKTQNEDLKAAKEIEEKALALSENFMFNHIKVLIQI